MPSPSKRIQIAMIGMGRQARGANLPTFLHDESTKVVAVCDVDRWRLDNAKKKVDDFYKSKDCVAAVDWREIVARDDVDAVMNSTSDHWHVPISLAAVRRGMHVSCEKPLTLSVAEGRVLADAVAKHGVVGKCCGTLHNSPLRQTRSQSPMLKDTQVRGGVGHILGLPPIAVASSIQRKTARLRRLEQNH